MNVSFQFLRTHTKKIMQLFSSIRKKLKQLCSCSCFCRFSWFHLRGNRFSLELFYFLFISSLGYFVLHCLDTKTSTFIPKNLDLFFMSVSASTVSSMSTIEMEVFSNSQLVILTILMFVGGEVFTSMIVLYIRKFFLKVSPKDGNKLGPSSINYIDKHSCFQDNIELKEVTISDLRSSKANSFCCETVSRTSDVDMEDLNYKSIKFLCLVVLFYLVLVQFLGVVSVLIYINVISSAKNILKQKGLNTLIFSIFTIVSTFASCGFVPTKENMIPFRKNSGLLLILIPQVLLGNTLYPPLLRFSICAIGKFTNKAESGYLLKNSKIVGYHHLLSYIHSSLLVITVLAFIALQFVLFSSMEWNSVSLEGLNVYQKFVGILFQIVNTRHTGESIVDLSMVSAAVLVLFVVMMYLPPYTSFLPITQESCQQGSKMNRKVKENLIFSQLSYLTIFIILVCITERKQMVKDPLNFNVLNIVIEVISAYGNVGFSTGYSCDRQLNRDGNCETKWSGFSGKWTNQGKLVLIVVMIFGRLKKFNMNGGKTWKLL